MKTLKLLEARNFAEAHHASFNGQMHGTRPYVVHLDEVVGVLSFYGVDDEIMLQAAYLHDVLEDCSVTQAELQERFGKPVADLVYAVTNESGKNRKERHLKTYPQILAHPNALTLKLADRIANVEYSILTKSPLLQMYKKEYSSFRATLKSHYDTIIVGMMWERLDFLMWPRGQRS